MCLPATTTGLILANCSLNVSADTPPPAYMPPDEQLGQESQSMETSSSLVPPNMARGGEEGTQLQLQHIYVQKTLITQQKKGEMPTRKSSLKANEKLMVYSIEALFDCFVKLPLKVSPLSLHIRYTC